MVLMRVYKTGTLRDDVTSKVAQCKQNVFQGLKQNDIFSLNANVPDECSCVSFFKPKTSFFVSTFAWFFFAFLPPFFLPFCAVEVIEVRFASILFSPTRTQRTGPFLSK
jgi:hypothetical protein